MVVKPSTEGIGILVILHMVVTALSLVGSCVMTYYCIKNKPQRLHLHFVQWLAIAGLIFTIANLLSFFEPEGSEVNYLCYIEGTLRLWGYRFTLYLPAWISIGIYKEYTGERFNKYLYLKRALLIICPICLVLNLLPVALPKYFAFNNSDLYCVAAYNDNTIRDDNFKFLGDMLYTGIFNLGGVTMSVIYYIRTIRKTKELPEAMRNCMRGLAIYKLFWYPGFLLIIILPNMFVNIYNDYTGSDLLWAKGLDIAISHSVGLINAIVYKQQRQQNSVRPSDQLDGSASMTSVLSENQRLFEALRLSN